MVKVSICCITFNHAPYIRQCLDGFLMQKCNFEFEILIHDDASTDGTVEIIQEYKEKYPELIRPFFQVDNQYSKGVRGINHLYNFPRAIGKYIAMCEGDDYWTDAFKLQKQFDFMELNTDCSLCFHAALAESVGLPTESYSRRPNNIPEDSKFELKDIILGGGGFITTNSMFFLKKFADENPDWKSKSPVGDAPLTLILAYRGKVGYIDDVMSVYRVMSSNSSWSFSMKDFGNYKKHHYAIIEMWKGFDEWSDYKYHSFVCKKIKMNKSQYRKVKLKNMFKRLIS